MLYVEKIENHKIGNNTPFADVALSLGWTLTIDENDTEKAYDGSLWEKGYAPEKPQAEINAERISELKQLLANTDYIIIKLAEDAASREEYAEQLEQRKAWRKEINELEEILNPVEEVAVSKMENAETTGNGSLQVEEPVEDLSEANNNEVIEPSEASEDIVELYSMEI